MADTLGTIDIRCDAPSYRIVQACQRLGLRRPADVAWYHLGLYLHGHYEARRKFLARAWAFLRGLAVPCHAECVCGNRLPVMEQSLFQFASGATVTYRIGQCAHCQTIYWEESLGLLGSRSLP